MYDAYINSFIFIFNIISTNFSSFDNIQPHVLSSAFAFPYPITTMGVTETRNGISTKDILCKLNFELR